MQSVRISEPTEHIHKSQKRQQTTSARQQSCRGVTGADQGRAGGVGVGLGVGQLLQMQQETMRSCCQLSQHQGVLHLHSLLMVCWHQGQRRQDVPAAAAVASESESNCREMGRRHMQQPVAMGTAKPIKVCCTFTASSMVCWHSTGSVYLQQQQQHQCQTVGRLVCVCVCVCV